jgi:regulatory protein
MTSDGAAGRSRPRVETDGAGPRPGEPWSSEPWSGDVRLGVEAWGAGSPPPEDVEAAGPDADPESVARTILLDQLTGRARSRRELAEKLAKRNVPDDVATRLLDRFEEVGLVDDAAFAHAWVEGRHAARGLAPRALAQELRRKGVADDVVADALEQLGRDELDETARTLVRRKLRSLERFDDATRTRRLVGMLARKGYAPGAAFAIVREVLGESAESEDNPEIDI